MNLSKNPETITEKKKKKRLADSENNCILIYCMIKFDFALPKIFLFSFCCLERSKIKLFITYRLYLYLFTMLYSQVSPINREYVYSVAVHQKYLTR